MKTEIVCILDRSGSMSSIWQSALTGMEEFIAKQKKDEGEAEMTVVVFDDEYTLLADHININAISEKILTDNGVVPRSMTAYNDALGKTITSVGERLAKMKEADRPERVLFCIMTDGYENASREYTTEQVKKMVKHQEEKYSWDFLFMGANIDSAEEAKKLGIRAIKAADYEWDDIGVASAFSAASAYASGTRCAMDMENVNISHMVEAEDATRRK